MRKKELINPNEMLVANLVKFTEDDLLVNKLPNMNLRCTHEAYIIGTKKLDLDNLVILIDAIYDKRYPYFNTISEAEFNLGENSDSYFTIGALPITKFGITKVCTKEKMINEIVNKHSLYFNFSDDENIMKNKLCKK